MLFEERRRAACTRKTTRNAGTSREIASGAAPRDRGRREPDRRGSYQGRGSRIATPSWNNWASKSVSIAISVSSLLQLRSAWGAGTGRALYCGGRVGARESDRTALTGSGRSLGGGLRGRLGCRRRRAVGWAPGPRSTHPRCGRHAPPGRAGRGVVTELGELRAAISGTSTATPTPTMAIASARTVTMLTLSRSRGSVRSP